MEIGRLFVGDSWKDTGMVIGSGIIRIMIF